MGRRKISRLFSVALYFIVTNRETATGPLPRPSAAASNGFEDAPALCWNRQLWLQGLLRTTTSFSTKGAHATGAASRGKDWDRLCRCMARWVASLTSRCSVTTQYLPWIACFLWATADFKKTMPALTWRKSQLHSRRKIVSVPCLGLPKVRVWIQSRTCGQRSKDVFKNNKRSLTTSPSFSGRCKRCRRWSRIPL